MAKPVIPEPVTRLIDNFARLPGVGPKTASRLAYFLLRAPDDVSSAWREHREPKPKRSCVRCVTTSPEEDPCPICGDSSTRPVILPVSRKPLDVLGLERTNSFRGRYHVLHGRELSPRARHCGQINSKFGTRPATCNRAKYRENSSSAPTPGMEGDATACISNRNRQERLCQRARHQSYTAGAPACPQARTSNTPTR